MGVALPPMKQGRGICTVATFGSKLYVFGGLLADSTITGSTEVFDESKGAWEPLKAMPTARVGTNATVVGESIYLIGGQTHCTPLGSVEMLDTSTGTWTRCSPLSNARSSCCATLL